MLHDDGTSLMIRHALQPSGLPGTLTLIFFPIFFSYRGAKSTKEKQTYMRRKKFVDHVFERDVRRGQDAPSKIGTKLVPSSLGILEGVPLGTLFFS